MQREGKTHKRIKAVINWNPIEKRPRGRPKKRWKDNVKQDMDQLSIPNWEDYIQDREAWRYFV